MLLIVDIASSRILGAQSMNRHWRWNPTRTRWRRASQNYPIRRMQKAKGQAIQGPSNWLLAVSLSREGSFLFPMMAHWLEVHVFHTPLLSSGWPFSSEEKGHLEPCPHLLVLGLWLQLVFQEIIFGSSCDLNLQYQHLDPQPKLSLVLVDSPPQLRMSHVRLSLTISCHSVDSIFSYRLSSTGLLSSWWQLFFMIVYLHCHSCHHQKGNVTCNVVILPVLIITSILNIVATN